jgi:hypothetical protein
MCIFRNAGQINHMGFFLGEAAQIDRTRNFLYS